MRLQFVSWTLEWPMAQEFRKLISGTTPLLIEYGDVTLGWTLGPIVPNRHSWFVPILDFMDG